MSDISKIQLPTGGIYDVKDSRALHSFSGPYDSVSELPEEGSLDTIYIVKNSQSFDKDIFDEYIWLDMGSEGYTYVETFYDIDWDWIQSHSYAEGWETVEDRDHYTWAFNEIWTNETPYINGLEAGLRVVLNLNVYDPNSGEGYSATLEKTLQYDSDADAYYVSLPEVNVPDTESDISDYPDQRLWIYNVEDFDISYSYAELFVWTKISQSDRDWYNIYLNISGMGSNLELGNLSVGIELVSDGGYELLGKSLDNCVTYDKYNEDQRYIYNDINSLYNQRFIISGVYSSLSNLPQTGSTTTVYLVWLPQNEQGTNNRCAEYIWNPSSLEYERLGPAQLAGLSFAGPYNSVGDLPASGDSNKIYLVSLDTSEANNIYEEYLYIDNQYELIGTTEIDLSNYVTFADLQTYATYTEYEPSLGVSASPASKIGTLNINGNDNVLRSPLEIGLLQPNGVLFVPDNVVCTYTNNKIQETGWFIFETKNTSTIVSIHKIRDTSQGVNLRDSLTAPTDKICVGRIYNYQLEYYVISEGHVNKHSEYSTNATKSTAGDITHTSESSGTTISLSTTAQRGGLGVSGFASYKIFNNNDISKITQETKYVVPASSDNSRYATRLYAISGNDNSTVNRINLTAYHDRDTGMEDRLIGSQVNVYSEAVTIGRVDINHDYSSTPEDILAQSQLVVSYDDRNSNSSKNQFHNVADPTLTYDVANKNYVDNAISTAISNAIGGGY